MRVRAAIVRWAKRLAATAAAMLALVLLLLGGLQTPWAKAWLASALGRAASSDTMRITLKGLGGGLPFGPTLDGLTIAGPDGPWLEASDLTLDVAVAPLLRGRLRVNAVEAGLVRLQGMPSPSPEKKPPSMPELPPTPTWLQVDRLEVERFEVAEEIAGAPIALTASAAFDGGDEGDWSASLQAERLDAAGTWLRLQGRREDGLLDVVLEAHDAGLIEQLTGWPGPVAVELDAGGPQGDWQGHTAVRWAGHDLAGLTGTVRAEGRRARLALKGNAALDHPVLPEGPWRSLGDVLRLEAAVDLWADGRIQLRQAELATPGAELRLAAAGNVPAQRLGFAAALLPRAELKLPERLRPLAEERVLLTGVLTTNASGDAFIPGLAVRTSAGSIFLTGGVRHSGRFALARIQAQDGAKSLRALAGLEHLGRVDLVTALRQKDGAGFDAAALATGGRIQTAQASLDGFQLSAGGSVEAIAGGLTGGAVALKGHLSKLAAEGVAPRDVDVVVRGKPDGAEAVVIEAFELDDGRTRVAAEGALGLDLNRASLRFDAEVPSLQDWLALFGAPYDGAVSLQARVTREGRGDPWRIEADGQARDLTGFPRAVGGLLAGTLALEAEGALDGAAARLSQLRLAGPAFTLAARGGYDFPGSALTLQAEASVPDLSMFPEVDQGSASAVLTAQGPVDGFAAELQAEAADVVATNLRAAAVRTRVSTEGLPQRPHGRIRMAASSGSLEPDLTASWAWDGAALRVEDAVVQAGPNRLTATARARSEPLEIEAEAAIEAPDLSALSRLLNTETGGELYAEASGVYARSTGLKTSGELEAKALQLPWIQAESARMFWQMSGPLAEWRGGLKLNARGVSAAGVALRLARVDAQLDGPEASADLAVAGRLPGGVEADLTSSGSVRFDGRRAVLRSLNGSLAGYEVSLDGRAAASWNPAAFSVELPGLRVGEGRISASGRMTADDLRAEARWERVPLTMAKGFGGPAMSGVAEGEVRLSGRPQAPVAEANVRVTGFGMERVAPGGATLDASVEATYRAERLSATFSGQSKGVGAVSGEAALPMRLSLRPIALEVVEDTPLRGEANAKLRLEGVRQAFGFRDHLMEGALAAEASLAGSLDAPRVKGEATLSGARYEHAEFGVIVQDLQARATAGGWQAQLVELSATDGEGGTVTGEGAVNFAPGEPLTFDAGLTLDSMWVVRRDDVSARVSGEARALKTAQSAEVRGDLEVLDAIIDVGRIAPSNRVQVVEVDETVPPRDDEGAGREAGPPIGLDVAVNAPEGILLRGPGLKSAWGGQLDVEGTVAEPRISGEFRADTGEVRLLGREFDFGESFVSLDPQHPADPYLNVQLVTRAKDARAEVRLNGIVSDLEIDLTSDPPLPREEVLARVLFGRPLDRVTPLQMAQLARYGAVFSGQTSLNRLLGGGQVLGLDALDLRMGPGMEEPVLGIGKQLGDVYLELEQGLDPESTKAQVEIELSPTWRVTGESRPDASGSAGIFWEERY